MNKADLGLHAWGNIVPACQTCNATKQRKDWRDFIIERAGPDAAERHARVRAFLDEYDYKATFQLREVAEELYEEVGNIAMTLIAAKIKRVRAKLWRLLRRRPYPEGRPEQACSGEASGAPEVRRSRSGLRIP
jgi:hypothetical protein